MVESRQAPVVKPDRRRAPGGAFGTLFDGGRRSRFVALWNFSSELSQKQIWPGFFSRGPRKSRNSLYGLWTEASCFRAIIATLARLSVGFLISLVLGAILAFLMVHFHTFGRASNRTSSASNVSLDCVGPAQCHLVRLLPKRPFCS